MSQSGAPCFEQLAKPHTVVSEVSGGFLKFLR